ncbi:MAG: hypothetical protein U0T72_08615 [Chitinophagales bacterium]
MKTHSVKKIIAFIVLVPIALALFGYVFMLLWNWLMPEIFGLTTITFWQAFGLLALSKIIFGSIGGNWRSKARWRMEEKFAGMTSEEKECFKQEMRERCKKWGTGL